MDAALVKIDVAAASLSWSAAKLFDLVDGGSLLEKGFAWVFNVANDPAGDRRDLRFWFPEIQARSKGGSAASRYSHYEIAWVISRILPEKRVNFHAGEVDMLFQIRPRTRIDLHAELCGNLTGGRHFYTRTALAAFLQRRWLGAVCDRHVARTNNFPKSPITAVESGRSAVENEAGHSSDSPRAAVLKRTDTNKQTTHAAQILP